MVNAHPAGAEAASQPRGLGVNVRYVYAKVKRAGSFRWGRFVAPKPPPEGGVLLRTYGRGAWYARDGVELKPYGPREFRNGRPFSGAFPEWGAWRSTGTCVEVSAYEDWEPRPLTEPEVEYFTTHPPARPRGGPLREEPGLELG